MGVRVRKLREEGVETQAKDQPQHLQIHPNHNSLRWSTLLWEKKKETDTENKQFLHVKLADPIISSYAFFIFLNVAFKGYLEISQRKYHHRFSSTISFSQMKCTR